MGGIGRRMKGRAVPVRLGGLFGALTDLRHLFYENTEQAYLDWNEGLEQGTG